MPLHAKLMFFQTFTIAGQQLHQPQPQQHRRPHGNGNYGSSEVTKNILRELFEKRPQPPPLPQKHQSLTSNSMNPFSRGKNVPNGGYFGPGQAPGASHPKVCNGKFKLSIVFL